MIIYVDLNEKNQVRSWGTSRLTDTDIEVEIEDNHSIFEYAPHFFTLRDGKLIKDDSIVLERAKATKIKELSAACEQSIFDGFTHEVNGIPYHFSFDVEAQFNFHATQTLFNSGMIKDIMWTVKKDDEYTRIQIDKAIMDQLTLAILQHKNGNISKFRDFLEPLVQSATTIEEVNSIKWDSL